MAHAKQAVKADRCASVFPRSLITLSIANRYGVLACATGLLLACSQTVVDEPPRWELDREEATGVLLSVWGSAPDDVWAAGGQSGEGLLLHNDGAGWKHVEVDADQLLWWVYGFHASNVYAVGEGGLILHYDGVTWERVASGTDKHLYGVWGASDDEVWIAGGEAQGAPGSAIVLRGSGSEFQIVDDIPAELLPSAFFKVYGGPQGVMAVGSGGTVVRRLQGVWQRESAPTTAPIFSLWGRDENDVYAVGGYGSGEVLHFDGERWTRVDADLPVQSLGGVFTAPEEPTIAVGADSYVVEIAPDGTTVEPQLPAYSPLPVLHGVWGDGAGTTYAVGGNLWSYPGPMSGVIFRRQ